MARYLFIDIFFIQFVKEKKRSQSQCEVPSHYFLLEHTDREQTEISTRINIYTLILNLNKFIHLSLLALLPPTSISNINQAALKMAELLLRI